MADPVDVDVLRADLAKFSYHPGDFITGQISDVDSLEEDMESKLLIVFDGLAQELAIHTENLETEVSALRDTAQDANRAMLNEMDIHALRLDEVRDAVDDVKTAFERASEGAVKIGDRLSVSEAERQRVELSIELISFINWYDSVPEEHFAGVHSMTLDQLQQQAVPEALRGPPLGSALKKSSSSSSSDGWGRISQVLGYLRRVLYDLSSDYAQRGLQNILRVSEAAEQALLQSFLEKLGKLLDAQEVLKTAADDAGSSGNDKSDDELLLLRSSGTYTDGTTIGKLTNECRDLADWLHMYHNGQTLHKCFIYNVIEKRMPRVVMHYDGSPTAEPAATATAEEKKQYAIDQLCQAHSSSAGSVDYLSELFNHISAVCLEQFAIIRNIFPAWVVPKMTRVLIQRIYNDPAFGIQGRVDSVLHPKPPAPELPLPDYLESLLTVREKLAALYLILLDLCSHPAMRGMGRENSRDGARYLAETSADDFNTSSSAGTGTGVGGGRYSLVDGSGKRLMHGSSSSDTAKAGGDGRAVDSEYEATQKEKSLVEVQEFLDEQISHVLTSYMIDYFAKEQEHARNLYAEGLRRLFHADSAHVLVTAHPGQAPRLNADRVRSIADFLSTVANNSYLNGVLGISGDAINRMRSIARDEQKLPLMVKETYMLQLEFLVDGVFAPAMKACADFVTKQASKGSSNTVLPPEECLQLLGFISKATSTLKKNLESVFVPLLDGSGNIVVVCTEALRGALRPLTALSEQTLTAWVVCVVNHAERLLTSMQSKGDYGTTFLQSSSSTAGSHATVSAACKAACSALRRVAQVARSHEAQLHSLNTNQAFWLPLGRLLMGTLIAHIRKNRISEEGGERLLCDLDEYLAVFILLESKENIDMMLCLREIAIVFKTKQENVKKVVIEDLRHLDTDLVLALTRARSDYGTIQKSREHWTKTIAVTYSFAKWDHEPLWVDKYKAPKRSNSIIAGLLSNSPDGREKQYPQTLRKTGAPVSSLYIEMQQANSLNNAQALSHNSQSSAAQRLDFGMVPSGDKYDARTGLGSGPGTGTGTAAGGAPTDEQLYNITGASSYAAAMQSRFVHIATPGAGSRLVPSSLKGAKGKGSDSKNDSEERSSIGNFRPLTFLSNAMGGQGAQSRPDLVGKEVDNSRDTVSLVSRARNNLGMGPPPQSSSSASSAFFLGAAAAADASASESAPSSTPMRDRMSNVMSSMGSYAKGLSPERVATSKPASASATAATAAEKSKSSRFRGFFGSS